MRLGPFRWVQLYAGFAETQDEAKEALSKLPDFLPLPPASRHTPAFDAEIGKTYALAGGPGDDDKALPPLQAVTKACIALGHPILQTRSYYFIGLALEHKGDLDGAKKAYQVIVDRWGNAKPKSRTAEEAKKRLKVLE
jgi:serine/threonine-protein kinase